MEQLHWSFRDYGQFSEIDTLEMYKIPISVYLEFKRQRNT